MLTTDFISIPVLIWWFEEDINHRLLFLLIINSKTATKVINILCLKNVIQLSKREKRYQTIQLWRSYTADGLPYNCIPDKLFHIRWKQHNFFLGNDIKYFVMTGGLHWCEKVTICQFNSILEVNTQPVRLFAWQRMQRKFISWHIFKNCFWRKLGIE